MDRKGAFQYELPDAGYPDRTKIGQGPSWGDVVNFATDHRTLKELNPGTMFGRALQGVGNVARGEGDTSDAINIGSALAEVTPFGKLGAIGAGAFKAMAMLPKAGKAVDSALDMSHAARMARAREMGFDTDNVWYHGTTHDFPAFQNSDQLNPEGHFGAGHYFTSSPFDASENYAGLGPDLTNRIEYRAERLADDVKYERDVSDAVAERYAKWRARKELVGNHDGAIIPAYLRGTTVDVRPHTRGRPTTLEMETGISPDDFMEEARSEMPGADKWDIYGRAQELADEASANVEPKGALWDFVKSIRRQADEYGYDAGEVLSSLDDYLPDGAMAASDLDSKLRSSALMYAEHPETGQLVSSDIIRRAFNDAGYDNIIMDAKFAFPNMPNIPQGTSHIITSDPRNIRSVNAAFDPAKKNSSDLLASAVPGAVVAGGALGAFGLQPQTDEELY